MMRSYIQGPWQKRRRYQGMTWNWTDYQSVKRYKITCIWQVLCPCSWEPEQLDTELNAQDYDFPYSCFFTNTGIHHSANKSWTSFYTLETWIGFISVTAYCECFSLFTYFWGDDVGLVLHHYTKFRVSGEFDIINLLMLYIHLISNLGDCGYISISSLITSYGWLCYI